MVEKEHDKNHKPERAGQPGPFGNQAPKPVPATGGLPPEAYMTEQEKDAANNSAKQPYPTGDPPPPLETTTLSHGIKGVTDQEPPAAKPRSR